MFDRLRDALWPRPAPPPPAPPPPKARRWDEAAFVDRLEDLVAAGKGETALDFMLSELGGLAEAKLHRRKKLNHLRFAGRILEGATSSKHGPEKLARKTRIVRRGLEGLGMRVEGSFLDFGCGRHDPVALAAMAYANGFGRAVACDMKPVEIPAYSAVSMYDNLLEMHRWPGRFLLPGTERAAFAKRLEELDPMPFRNRDFKGGLAKLGQKIEYRLAELTTLDIADGELGFAVSFAVLEHVMRADEIYDWLFRKTQPGGGQCHYIDLADHRSYGRKRDYDAWSFLTSETAPATVNRLRAHEHIALVRRSGFEIVEESRVTRRIPPATRERLLPPWRDLPAEELETIGLRLLLRRPQ